MQQPKRALTYISRKIGKPEKGKQVIVTKWRYQETAWAMLPRSMLKPTCKCTSESRAQDVFDT